MSHAKCLRTAENTVRTILKKLACRPFENEENIAVSSPQGAAVFSSPKYRDSQVQFLEEIARGNRYSDVNSLALKIGSLKKDMFGSDFPSDLWSLGCTWTEMSTRKHPRYQNGNDKGGLTCAAS
ncbi:hypothetical protein SADUNF_Sadunf17G0016400 [Salix dunnii]|uniref:Uncharacterized protein n=1 Tax=Salix dunnii TaxID=1413687 RepID=A0A835J638_9ROSI|nr:hypothetical protein SADUNF_Sadunf17G0016400 [Salix dunnii]